MKKFTIYDENLRSTASDRTEIDWDLNTKPTLAVSKTTLWMMAIAAILLCLAIWQFSNKDEAGRDSFENRIETKKL